MTETDTVKEALAVAAEHWPGLKDQPTALLNALIEFARRTLVDDQQQRLHDIESSAGTLDGVFTADSLDQLRKDWPA